MNHKENKELIIKKERFQISTLPLIEKLTAHSYLKN